MIGRVFVYGLWHLGPVTAACCATQFETLVHDPDPAVRDALRAGRPPVAEPGLAELLVEGQRRGRLRVVDDLGEAETCDVVWITFDTPLDAAGAADAPWLSSRLDPLIAHLAPGTLVVVSSQVPLGFTRMAAAAARGARSDAGLRFACVPENLRLGSAVEGFTRAYAPAGTGDGASDDVLAELLAPWVETVDWMRLESAELAKHATNAFLATTVALTNELARVGERAGADATAIERVLRADPRVGPRAYVRAGEPFEGATLQRDVATLVGLGSASGVAMPLLDGVLASNELHRQWARDALESLLDGVRGRIVTVLGMAAKVDTDSLRGSAGAELARWLVRGGATVRAVDPAVAALPDDLSGEVELLADTLRGVDGADAAVVATPWPHFAELDPDRLTATMRRPVIVDPGGFLEPSLGHDPRLRYIRVGRPTPP
jgi:UDPglucose 6-dehydrogenase